MVNARACPPHYDDSVDRFCKHTNNLPPRPDMGSRAITGCWRSILRRPPSFCRTHTSVTLFSTTRKAQTP
eukprot:2492405-Rhodomonas_salina.1